MFTKPELRTLIKSRLLSADPEQAIAWSLNLCDRLWSWPAMRSAQTVMAFTPLPGEAEIRPLLSRIIESGRRLCLPRSDWSARAMEPARVDSLSDLVEVRHGLREPAPAAEAVPITELDAILVPGLAFDPRGNRLGRGAGFYDRFLARLGGIAGGAPAACGVAFELQIVQDVPIDPWDVRLDAIATESRWIEVAPSRP